jgi:hypothetical protein
MGVINETIGVSTADSDTAAGGLVSYRLGRVPLPFENARRQGAIDSGKSAWPSAARRLLLI